MNKNVIGSRIRRMMYMSTYPTIVITGATNGLGQLVAIELAQRGAHLVLTARNEKRAETTKNVLKDLAPSTKVDFFRGLVSYERCQAYW